MSTAFERVKRIVDDLLDEKARPDTALEDMECGELDRYEIAMAIEEEFGLDSLTNETVTDWVTVGDIVTTAEGVGCLTVEPLGNVAHDGKLATFHDSKNRPGFLQESSGLLWVGKLDQANSSLSFKRAQVASLLASLQAWLDTGNFSITEETRERRSQH